MSPQPLPLETPRTRIVIVDDDDLFRESRGLNLAEHGFEVVDFSGGPPALDYLLAGNGADVILLDWRMPGLDGPAVLRRLRESEVHVPVVFLTMLSDEIYEEKALKWGAVDFIDKARRLPIILGRLRLITEGAKPIPVPAGQAASEAAEAAGSGSRIRSGAACLRAIRKPLRMGLRYSLPSSTHSRRRASQAPISFSSSVL